MFHFDNRTLMSVLIIVLFITLIFSFFVAMQRRQRFPRLWVLGNTFVFLGFLLMFFQGAIHSGVSVILANSLLALGNTCQVYSAVRQFSDAEKNSVPLAVVGLLVLTTLLAYFTFLSPSVGFRVVLVSIYLVAISSYGLFRTGANFASWRSGFNGRYALGVVFCLNALFYLCRAVYTALFDMRMHSLFSLDFMTSLSLLFYIFYQISLTLAVFAVSIQLAGAELEKEKNRLKILLQFIEETGRKLTLPELYEAICDVMIRYFKIDSLAIYLASEDRRTNTLVYQYALNEKVMAKAEILHQGEGLSGRVIESNDLIVVDIDHYPEASLLDILKQLSIEYLAAVPIQRPERAIGAILLGFKSKERNLALDTAMLRALSGQFGLVIGNGLLYGELDRMAQTDPLTGLSNRRQVMLFAEKEEYRFKRNGTRFCVAMVDIDRFKSINDTWGHAIGDLALRHLADCLGANSRSTDSIGRWGGEEFLLVLSDTDIQSATTIGERIRSQVEDLVITCDSGPVHITVSIGIAEIRDEESLDACIGRSDKKLYEAKSGGRNRVAI